MTTANKTTKPASEITDLDELFAAIDADIQAAKDAVAQWGKAEAIAAAALSKYQLL